MCRHTYHHYPACGHISSFTVAACPEFTNQLRASTTIGQSIVCDEVKMTHDLLSASQPSACVECEREWREIVARGPQETMCSRANISIEGLAAMNPIFEVAVRMTLDGENGVSTTDDPQCGDEMCDIYLDIAREHDRSCDCCGPDESAREGVNAVQNAPSEGINGVEKLVVHADNEDSSFFAQPEVMVPESNISHSPFDSVLKWLQEIEPSHEQDMSHAPPSLTGQHFDLLEELPADPQVISPGFDIFVDVHKRISAWLDHYDVDHEPEESEVQQPDIQLCPRIDLLEDLPSRGELITNLCQALKTTPPGTDLMELRSITLAEESTPLPAPEQLRSPSVTSTQPSTINSELWHAEVCHASNPPLSMPQESEGDGYDWLPSRNMSPMPRISGILWTLPLKREKEADDEHSQPFEESVNHPVIERQPTPFVSTDETPPPEAPRRFMAAVSEGVARSHGLRFPLRIGGLYTGF